MIVLEWITATRNSRQSMYINELSLILEIHWRFSPIDSSCRPRACFIPFVVGPSWSIVSYFVFHNQPVHQVLKREKFICKYKGLYNYFVNLIFTSSKNSFSSSGTHSSPSCTCDRLFFFKLISMCMDIDIRRYIYVYNDLII